MGITLEQITEQAWDFYQRALDSGKREPEALKEAASVAFGRLGDHHIVELLPELYYNCDFRRDDFRVERRVNPGGPVSVPINRLIERKIYEGLQAQAQRQRSRQHS